MTKEEKINKLYMIEVLNQSIKKELNIKNKPSLLHIIEWFGKTKTDMEELNLSSDGVLYYSDNDITKQYQINLYKPLSEQPINLIKMLFKHLTKTQKEWDV